MPHNRSSPSSERRRESHLLVTAISEAVDRAWRGEHSHGDSPRFPLSIIGALALLDVPITERTRVTTILRDMPPAELGKVISDQWAIFVRGRPDLVNRAWPLISVWHGENPPTDTDTKVATAITDAAVRAGLLKLTGDWRTDVDLFGVLLPTLRSASAIKALGQFPTPPDVADMIARTIGPPRDGQRFYEPTAGTGGMLRAAAEAMRAAGSDPTTVEWWAVDIDELSIACLTVNVVLWGLGPKVVLGVGDVLADPDWTTRALGERAETLRVAGFARAAANAMALLGQLEQPSRTDPGDQPARVEPAPAENHTPAPPTSDHPTTD